MKMSFFMDTCYTENQQILFFTHMITQGLFHQLHPREKKKERFSLMTRCIFTQPSLTQSVATTETQPMSHRQNKMAQPCKQILFTHSLILQKDQFRNSKYKSSPSCITTDYTAVSQIIP